MQTLLSKWSVTFITASPTFKCKQKAGLTPGLSLSRQSGQSPTKSAQFYFDFFFTVDFFFGATFL
jgi:hypothetical protein